MPTVGKIKIDLTAGTAQFNSDMDRASQKLKEFGSHGVTQMQAVSGTIRALEGNGIRAAERLISSWKGVGAVFQAAFPVAGGIAIAEMVGRIVGEAGKAYEAFKKLQDAPKRIAQEFQGLTEPIRLSNLELQVANDKLANEIAKLEHKPGNGLKLALDEAYLSAERLSGALQKDLGDVAKLLDQNKVGFLGWAMGKTGNDDVSAEMKRFAQDLQNIDTAGQMNIHAAGGNTQAALAALKQLNQTTKTFLDEEIRHVQAELKDVQDKQNDRYIKSPLTGNVVGENPAWRDRSATIAGLQGAIDVLMAHANSITLNEQHDSLQARKDQLEATPQEKPEDYFADLMAKRQAELSGAKSEAASAGNVLSEALAQGASKAAQDIAELNKELAKNKEALTLSQQAAITATDTQISLTELSKRLTQQKAEADKKAAEDYIKSREEMAAAEERLAKVAEEKQKQEIDRFNKLRGDLTAIKYEIEAAWGSAEEQFQAKLAGIRAQGRENDTPQAQIDEQIQRATAQHELENKHNLTGDYGSAADGAKAYFDEMVANARTAAQQVHDLLSNAFQSLNDTLARAMTGQKANWSSFFRGLSEQLSKMALQNAEVALVKGIHPANQQGGQGGGGVWNELASLGPGGGAKRDGSSKASALYVNIANGTDSSTGADLSDDSADDDSDDDSGSSGGGLGGLFGRLLKGLFGGFRAEGGSVDPGQAYMVGEKGPELWVPPSAGTVIPNHKLAGNQTVIHVDARGSTDPVMTAAQTRRAVIAAHNSAISNSVRAVQERNKRRPQ